jgi:hypothetical protein
MKLNKALGLGAVLSLVVTLAACGGGGSGGTADVAVGGDPSAPPGSGGTVSPAPEAPVPQALAAMVDSYGTTMPDSFAAGVATAAGVDGTAADGAAIANAPVQVFDKAGRTVSTTTDANGIYHARIDGFEPPMIAAVTKPDGSKWYSPSLAAPISRGFIHINITGLTDKIASDIAVSIGKSGASQLTMADIAAHPAALATAKTSLNSSLSTLLATNRLDANAFDPVTAVFMTDHTGYDKVLDQLVITKASGATVVTPGHALGGAISGLGHAADLQLSIGEDVLTVPADATSFTFTHLVAEGSTYHVSIKTQPAGLGCFLDTASSDGTMGKSDVSSISVRCLTRVAGDMSQAGASDGISGGRFTAIDKLTTDRNGDVYVADNGMLRKITSDGWIHTLVLQLLSEKGARAGITTDASGALYFLDGGVGSISKLTPDGVVRWLTGNAFASPMATDAQGNVYLTDFTTSIYVMTPTGSISPVAGGAPGYLDGSVSVAQFRHPAGIAVDAAGNLFVADSLNNAIRRITPAGQVTTVADASVGIKSPKDLAIAGSALYVGNSGNSSVLRLAGVAGTATTPGAASAIPAVVTSNVPFATMTADGAGKVYLGVGTAVLSIP